MSLWVDPLTAEPLRRDGPLLRSDSGGIYPTLGGVPILVPNPASWIANHRDAVLATLVESGLADPATVAVVGHFAAAIRGAEPMHWGDDWVPNEDAPPAAPPPGGLSRDLFAEFLRSVEPLADRLAALLPHGAPSLEVGCGAGALTHRLAGTRYVMDRSLRAVLRATEGLAQAHPVVAEAEQLPFQSERFESVVAANVIDLLDRPSDFLEQVVRVLRPGGQLVLSTPDPALGTGLDSTLVELMAEVGLHVQRKEEGVPWIRSHSARNTQVYFVQLIVAHRA